MMGAGMPEHLRRLRAALDGFAEQAPILERWGRRAAGRLLDGGRLLAAGNGGSAAEAQHLAAELVGRFDGDRQPLSAIPLHTDGSSVSAIANDYGAGQVYARQVRAHGRPGDLLVLLSTSGSSPNVLAAADTGHDLGLAVWALTGPAPNPLADRADDVLAVAAPHRATVQELHLVAVHVFTAAVERAVAERLAAAPLPASAGGC